MLSLVETYCVPILTYGIEIADFLDAGQRSKVRAAYNSLFRKIFGYRTFESVTNLQLSLARPTWEMLCHTRKVSFHNRLAQCPAESPVHVFSVLWFDLLFLLSLFVYWNTRFDQIVWIKPKKNKKIMSLLGNLDCNFFNKVRRCTHARGLDLGCRQIEGRVFKVRSWARECGFGVRKEGWGREGR